MEGDEVCKASGSVIIYKETKTKFIGNVDNNALKRRLVDGFRTKTGSVPSDQNVWADEYSRFSLALRNAKVSDEIQIAIEYHITAAVRFRLDVLLAGNNGETDNGMTLELKAWETAQLTDIDDMVRM